MSNMKRFLLLIVFTLVAIVVAFGIYSRLTAPTESDYRMARGRAYLETENYLAALKTLRALPAAQRERPETRSFIGAAYLRLHLYQAAIHEFEEATKQDKRRADPWLGLADAYIELGNAEKAIDSAKHAASINGKSIDAWI